MSAFWIACGIMVLVVLATLLRALLGRDRDTNPERHLASLRSKLASLQAQHLGGSLDEASYQEKRRELADPLLESVEQELAPAPQTDRASRVLSLILIALLPISAFSLYAYLGAGQVAMYNDSMLVSGGADDQSLEAMTSRLEKRLQETPDDGPGWDLLGQTYLAQGRFAEAESAYQHAYRLLGDEPDVLVRYAEAMARARDGNLVGEPSALIERALILAPDDELTLWYGGLAAYQRGEPELTVVRWKKLLFNQDPNSEAAQAINSQLARIEAELEAGQSNNPPSAANDAPILTNTEAALQVQVSLSAPLQSKSDPSATLFIYARAANGPKAPLALVRERAGSIPVSVTLNDSQAMMPQLTLSKFPNVEVVARISTSGEATPQPGDLIGVSAPIDQQAQQGPVQVVINEVVE